MNKKSEPASNKAGRNKKADVALKTFLIAATILGERSFLIDPAYAWGGKHKNKHQETEAAPAAAAAAKLGAAKFDQLLGLDASTLQMVNEGKWQEAASALESQTSGNKTAGKKDAWLAFAYLYLNSCDKLKVLNDTLGVAPSATPPTAPSPSATSGDPPVSANPSPDSAASTATSTTTVPVSATSTTVTTTSDSTPAATTPATATPTSITPPTNRYAAVITSFERVCEGHKDDAGAILQNLPSDAESDPICVFARAAVASKRGLTTDAAGLCQTVVGLAPNFAWGFRTLGFLQQFSLRHPGEAEVSYEKALAIEPDLDAVRKTLIQMKVARNDYDDALDIARAAVALHPQDAGVHYNLADEIFIKQWRLREASSELDSAIKYDANNAKYYRAQAGVKRLQGNLQEALAAQEMAVKLGSDKAFELVELANLQQLMGNNGKAADILQQAIKLEPGNASAHEKLIVLLENEHRYDELIAEYTRLIGEKPKDAKLHLRLAKALANAGKVQEAEKEYVQAANLDDKDPEPHRQMGALKIRLREFGAAAKEYTRALNLNPSSVPDLVSLGYCYSENDDYMQAEAAYVTALALQQLLVQSIDITSERLDIMRALAVLLVHETRYSDGANQFESIIAMRKPGGDASLDQFMLARARAFRDLTAKSAADLTNAFNNLNKQQQNDQSLWLVDTFLRMKRPELAKDIVLTYSNDPADSDRNLSWLLTVGRYNLATGNGDGAKQALLKVTDSKQADASLKAQALLIMAEGFYQAGDLAEAEKTVRGSLDTYSKSFKAYVLGGRIALKNKDAKLALDFAKKALEQNPYDANAYIVNGQAQSLLGQTKESIASFRKATELYPAMAEGHKLLAGALNKSGAAAESKKESELAASLETQEK